jgi:2-oxoisovalerate dehydrogenase E1 component alpha subunit
MTSAVPPSALDEERPLLGEDQSVLSGDRALLLRVRDLYARMLFTRIVDDYIWRLHTQGFIDCVVSCRGHEAAQVGSAVCIDVGNDFTLPYYRDLGVVLTIGMTPHEVFRTYLHNRSPHHPPFSLTSLHASSQHESSSQCTASASSVLKAASTSKRDPSVKEDRPFHHWAYHKHNMVTGPAPVATQLLHAAGIAFASKLRNASVVTVAYCGDGVTTEADFLKGLQFAVQHQLPVIFICEHASLQQPRGTATPPPSCVKALPLPAGLTHRQIDGTNVITVYESMQAAMQRAREGHGPVLLEVSVVRSLPNLHLSAFNEAESKRPFVFDGFRKDRKNGDLSDPLVHCQHYLQTCGAWDDDWADQLCVRISKEIECAWHDVLHDILQSS